MRAPSRLAVFAALIASLASLSGRSEAQTPSPAEEQLAIGLDTGLRPSGELPTGFEVRVEHAGWIRLSLDGSQLGEHGLLCITSLADGASQTLDARQLEQWGGTSAYFNGASVWVELRSRPGGEAVRLVVEEATIGLPAPLASQCGPSDDRVASDDPSTTRILPVLCTGFLIDDSCGCLLTAGHCSDGAEVIEFHVPASMGDGTIRHPGPENQYAVDPASMQSNGGQGEGNDYAYFGVFPNTETGRIPSEVQGVFEVAAPPATLGHAVRITGFGTDPSPRAANHTQQTHVGPRVPGQLGGSPLAYQADTMAGNSGGPVIHEGTGRAIGIHTHGGCTAISGNAGTPLNHVGLTALLLAPAGVCDPSSAGASHPFGSGVGGANVVELQALSVPTAGADVDLGVSARASGPFALLWVSTEASAVPLFGGTVLAGLAAAVDWVLLPLSDGDGSTTIPLPPGASGLYVFVQAALRDGSQPQGWAFSNGLRLRIG